MTTDALTPPDNGSSFMGIYGIANPTVCWLIGKGHGDLVALRTDELQRGRPPAPICRAVAEVEVKLGKWQKQKPRRRGEKPPRCERRMGVRPFGWACYQHAEPIRAPYPAYIQKVPNFPGRIEDALTSVVDMQYARNPLTGRTEWTYSLEELKA